MQDRTTDSRVELGVVGCGGIAQMMHLPNLREHPTADVVALCDRDPSVLNGVGSRFDVSHQYESVSRFLDQEAGRLDGVLVCTPSHTRLQTARPVLERGLPALIEKPVAATPDGADALVAAADADATTMVGYMKRYHPTVMDAYQSIDSCESIDHVEMYDVDPAHGRIIQELHSPIGGPPTELPPTRVDKISAALGTDSERLVEAYSFQVEHICHDINLLRGAFSDVTKIDHIDVFNEGRYLTASLRYDGIRVHLTSGTSERRWFEEYLCVDTPDRRIQLSFDNPFKRHAPPSLEVTQGDDAFERTTSRSSYQDSFALELDHFVRCLRGNATPRTPLVEAAADVHLIAQLFQMVVKNEGLAD